MKDESPKNKLISKIASVNNILITVSRNPSIDQLSSALALAMAINKMGKRAVAVFSGKIPNAINFLHPEKTFEDNADSLRDFIISLSRDKADRLQCKPDGDFVKVYITPYKTKITPNDLKFEQGDFNIELIIAIGVVNRDDLDAAVAAHGKIFHNAIVATINCGQVKDVLGTISWQDGNVQCYSEMCASLIDDLAGANGQLVDDAIATALLTGVVAATDQFRNNYTTPAIMTLSADLMANGANQQLITSELSNESPAETTNNAMQQMPKLDNVLSVHQTNTVNPPVAPMVQAVPAAAGVNDNQINQDRVDLGQSRSMEALDAAESQLHQNDLSMNQTGSTDKKLSLEPSANLEQQSAQVADNRPAVVPLSREPQQLAHLNMPSPDKPSLPSVMPPLDTAYSAAPLGQAPVSSGSVNRPSVQPMPQSPQPYYGNGINAPLPVERTGGVITAANAMAEQPQMPNEPSLGMNSVNNEPNIEMPLPPPPPIPNFGTGEPFGNAPAPSTPVMAGQPSSFGAAPKLPLEPSLPGQNQPTMPVPSPADPLPPINSLPPISPAPATNQAAAPVPTSVSDPTQFVLPS